jgi:hypothetical protein
MYYCIDETSWLGERLVLAAVCGHSQRGLPVEEQLSTPWHISCHKKLQHLEFPLMCRPQQKVLKFRDAFAHMAAVTSFVLDSDTGYQINRKRRMVKSCCTVRVLYWREHRAERQLSGSQLHRSLTGEPSVQRTVSKVDTIARIAGSGQNTEQKLGSTVASAGGVGYFVPGAQALMSYRTAYMPVTLCSTYKYTPSVAFGPHGC